MQNVQGFNIGCYAFYKHEKIDERLPKFTLALDYVVITLKLVTPTPKFLIVWVISNNKGRGTM